MASPVARAAGDAVGPEDRAERRTVDRRNAPDVLIPPARSSVPEVPGPAPPTSDPAPRRRAGNAGHGIVPGVWFRSPLIGQRGDCPTDTDVLAAAAAGRMSIAGMLGKY